MNTFQRVSAAVNVVVQPLIGAPIVGKLLGRSMTFITYVGRKSGRTFSAPVSYKRKGDHVTIGVAMPDKKSWWRNFYPEQGPIVLQLDGIDRPGEALAQPKRQGCLRLRRTRSRRLSGSNSHRCNHIQLTPTASRDLGDSDLVTVGTFDSVQSRLGLAPFDAGFLSTIGRTTRSCRDITVR